MSPADSWDGGRNDLHVAFPERDGRDGGGDLDLVRHPYVVLSLGYTGIYCLGWRVRLLREEDVFRASAGSQQDGRQGVLPSLGPFFPGGQRWQI